MKQFKALIFLASVYGCSPQPSSQTKIVGGSLATQTYEFFVGIYDEGYTGSTFCGGALIEKDVVLTAAHCVSNLAGALSVSIGIKDSNLTDPSLLRRVKAVAVHPDYNNPAVGNDVALLFLEPQAAGETLVKPIALNSSADAPAVDSFARVIGHGNTTSVGYMASAQLREIDVPVLASGSCAAFGGLYANVNDRMLCAGQVFTGGGDSCQGDSGGPLFIPGPEPRLVGVVSYGDSCAQRAKPGVYTRVSSFIPWIESTIEAHKNPPAVMDSPAINDLVQQYCYFSRADVKRVNEYPSNLTYSAYLNLNYDFAEWANSAEAEAELRNHDVISVCQFVLPTGAQAELQYLKSKATDLKQLTYPLVLKINDRWYKGSSTPTKVASFFCQKSGGDFHYLSFNYYLDYNMVRYSSFFENGYGSVLDAPEYGRGLPIDRPTGLLKEQLRCKAGDSDLRVVTGKDHTYASVRVQAGEAPQWFELLENPAFEETPGLHIKLVPMGETKAIMEVINDTNADLFTWTLNCPFAFRLKDRNQTLYPASGAPATKSVSFEHPTDRNGAIPAGLSRTFTLEVEATTIDDILGQSCAINGMTQDFEYELL